MSSIGALTGIFPAALTMFDADGRLDVEASAAHALKLVERGAHGVVVAGTSGEFVALDSDERRALIAEVCAALAGRAPVVASTGTYSTAETVRLTRSAADAGAAAALVILPYYQRPNRREVMEHYRALAAETGLPVLVYNNPANSGTEPLDARDLGQLAAEGAVHGVKSTFPTVHQVHEVIAETPESFRTFYGSFMAPLEGMAAGACGWISGILNVALADALALWEAMTNGDLAKAREAWARILPYKYLYTRQPLGPVSDLEMYRSILRLRGEHGGHSRRPLLPLTDEQNAKLAELLATFDASGR